MLSSKALFGKFVAQRPLEISWTTFSSPPLKGLRIISGGYMCKVRGYILRCCANFRKYNSGCANKFLALALLWKFEFWSKFHTSYHNIVSLKLLFYLLYIYYYQYVLNTYCRVMLDVNILYNIQERVNKKASFPQINNTNRGGLWSDCSNFS